MSVPVNIHAPDPIESADGIVPEYYLPAVMEGFGEASPPQTPRSHPSWRLRRQLGWETEGFWRACSPPNLPLSNRLGMSYHWARSPPRLGGSPSCASASTRA